MPDTNEEGDPINPRKAGGGQGGFVPPGGGAPGPGGGFGGAFGGGGFFGSDINTGGAAYGMPRRRIVMGPNGPISVAGSPMSTDTVPAMLTPGEGVLNTGAMSQPGVPEFLRQANAQGVAQMAQGGMVGEPMDKALLLKLLRLLLDDGAEGEVQGFAYGGMVRPQAGGFSQQPLGAPRMPAGGLQGRFAAPRPSPKFGSPTGQPARPPMVPGPAPVVPGTMGPGPSTVGNPFDDVPRTPGSTNPGDDWMARLRELIGDFGDFGSFSPEGSAQVMNAVRGEATQNADALRQRARLNADVSGLDAGQRGSYAMQQDLGTRGDVSRILSDAHMKQLLGQQQFGQQMLGQVSEAQMQAWLARLASWMKGGG